MKHRARTAATALLAVFALGSLGSRPWSTARAAPLPADHETIAHVLSRITFGLRPGDIEAVGNQGLARYIEEQLHPEGIRDEATAARLAGLTSIEMSSREIAETFSLP